MGTTMSVHKHRKNERFHADLRWYEYERTKGSYTCMNLTMGSNNISLFWNDEADAEEDLRKLRHAIDEYLLQQVTGVDV